MSWNGFSRSAGKNRQKATETLNPLETLASLIVPNPQFCIRDLVGTITAIIKELRSEKEDSFTIPSPTPMVENGNNYFM